MSEVELYLIQDGDNCTIYTLQFLRDTENEFEKFISKFKESAEYSEDYIRIAAFISRIARTGASERYFRQEGKMNDSVVALPRSYPPNCVCIACDYLTKSLFLEMEA